MKEFENVAPLKAVYCYYFPEVRSVVDKIYSGNKNLNDIYLTQTDSNTAQQLIEGLNFKKSFDVPKNSLGKVDLDMLHEPVIDVVIEEYKDVVPALKDFKYRYFTSGSSEGIFHYLSKLKSNGENKILNLLGEYEGYREYGKTIGLRTEDVSDEDADKKQGNWLISNPNARNGNILNNSFIENICNNNSRVAVDLAYVGSTNSHVFDISNPNIETVFMSFSKPYGLFRYRLGFTFSRAPIDSLYANKWFKSIPNLLLALKVAQDIGPNKLPLKYKQIQSEIVGQINNMSGLNMKESDVLLLANISKNQTNDLSSDQIDFMSQFLRDKSYRFCLTPFFEEREKNERT